MKTEEIQINLLRLNKIYPEISYIAVLDAIDEIQFTDNLTQLKLFTIIIELGKTINDTKTSNRTD